MKIYQLTHDDGTIEYVAARSDIADLSPGQTYTVREVQDCRHMDALQIHNELNNLNGRLIGE